MKIIYYVTAHGYGHGVRTCAIVNELPPDTEVVFRTVLPESFFREEVRRRFIYAPASFDCGCIQKDGITADIPATLNAYARIAEQNESRFADEVAWCRDQEPSLIASDIVPLAFDVAKACGIPSVAATNFTWYDIYAPYCRDIPGYQPLLAGLREQYASASLLLALDPAMLMDYFPVRAAIGPVARKGTSRRSEIVRHYGIEPGHHIGLLYVGQGGVDGFDAAALERFSGWEFLGVSPIGSAPANFRLIDKSDFPYQDLAASADCMIGKLGYSAVAEAMVHGTPMIYLPREDFAEYAALDAAVRTWGGGAALSAEEFLQCTWESALNRCILLPRPAPVHAGGARQAAAYMVNLAGA
jgi:UDP:flavonoid glycosyltransferase YjiC (YdhE family)